MKNLLKIIFILFFFQSCSQNEEILIGLGKAKIGMSVNDFFNEITFLEETVDSTLIYEKNFKHKFTSLKVSENITLKNTTVVFKNGILESIEAENSQQLFEILEKKYKVKTRKEYGKVYILEFDTKSEKTKCMVIGNAETKSISLSESQFVGE